jgi:hypothetical protein
MSDDLLQKIVDQLEANGPDHERAARVETLLETIRDELREMNRTLMGIEIELQSKD